MDRIFIGIGSNQGNRRRNILTAINNIKSFPTEIVNISSCYKTAAWGPVQQDDFYNCVIEIKSDHKPHMLLSLLLETEMKMGRIRTQKFGPRIIDLDIIFYSSKIISDEHLNVPHPYLQERNFVLIPMGEIAPDFVHPVLKKNIKELLQETIDISNVHKLKRPLYS